MTPPVVDFELAPHHVADRPPEARGRRRDGVRLLVASPKGLVDTRMRDLARHLQRGDVLVVNTSATVPAALPGRRHDGRRTVVHVADELSPESWIVELRRPDGSGPQLDGRPGEDVRLAAGPRLRLDRAAGAADDGVRLWRASPLATEDGGDPPVLGPLLSTHGRPVSYAHVAGAYPLADHQTIFARHPGSAEMPSAGRPFTRELLLHLDEVGAHVAPVVLHTGLSSPEAGEPPQPERFEVPARTAERVNLAHALGHRVIAVGTTVVRALESATDGHGDVVAACGRTRLVVGPWRPAQVVDGLLTGWHEAAASHLQLVVAVAGEALVNDAYRAALDGDYLWHEFGDVCLLLP